MAIMIVVYIISVFLLFVVVVCVCDVRHLDIYNIHFCRGFKLGIAEIWATNNRT